MEQKDIRVETNDYKFHFRVVAVIEQNGKILIQHIDNTEYWVLPGGHVMYGETSLEALKREVKEEIGIDINPQDCKLFCFHENFYMKGKQLQHWLENYFIVKPQNPLPQKSWETEENDKGVLKHLQFKWVTRDELKEIELKPVTIKNLIADNKTNGFTHLIDKNN